MKSTSFKVSIVLASIIASGMVSAEVVDQNTNSFDLTGFRVGVGLGIVDASGSSWDNDDYVLPQTQYENENFDADTDFFVEVGYDVNGIIGLSAALGKGSVSYSYEQGTKATNSAPNTPFHKNSWKNDYTFLKLATDLGYTFALTDTQSLKPYVKVGIVVQDVEHSSSSTSYSSTPVNVDNDGNDNSNSSLVTGLGLRYNMDHVFYADLSYEKSNLWSTDLETINISAGYKF